MKWIWCGLYLLFFLNQVMADERLTFYNKPNPLPDGAVTENWPRFLGPHHNGMSKESKLLKTWPEKGPKVVWELERGETYAAPTIVDGRLFSFDLADGNERLECRDPETGELKWEFKYPVQYRDRYGFANGPRASPVIDKEILIIAGVTGQIRAIEVMTGKPVWHQDLQKEYRYELGFFGYGPQPFVWKDLVLVNVGGSKNAEGKRVCVAAFDRKSGKEVWRYMDEWGASYSSPLVAKIRGKEVLLVLAGGESRPANGGLLVLDPSNGKLFHRFSWRADKFESVNASVPVVIDDKFVFLSECYGKGGALLEFDDKLNAVPVWQERWFGMHWMTPLVIEGHIYGFAGRNKPDVQFKCARVKDGEILWEDDMQYQQKVQGRNLTLSFFRGSLLNCDGRVFALGEDGVFAELKISPKEVKVTSRSQLFIAEQSWALPVIHRGLLYICQHTKGFVDNTVPRIICYDFREVE